VRDPNTFKLLKTALSVVGAFINCYLFSLHLRSLALSVGRGASGLEVSEFGRTA